MKHRYKQRKLHIEICPTKITNNYEELQAGPSIIFNSQNCVIFFSILILLGYAKKFGHYSENVHQRGHT